MCCSIAKQVVVEIGSRMRYRHVSLTDIACVHGEGTFVKQQDENLAGAWNSNIHRG